MQTSSDQVIETNRRRCFLVGLVADFTSLRKDLGEWQHVEVERTEWDATLADGDDT